MAYLSMDRYTKKVPSVPKKQPQPLPYSPLPIGKRIAALRKAKGLSQQLLADQLGLSQKQITAYETGKAHLIDEMIVRFSLALNISSDELLGLKDMEIPPESPSLRLSRRMRDLEQLPEAKKKAILKTLDDLIRANS